MIDKTPSPTPQKKHTWKKRSNQRKEQRKTFIEKGKKKTINRKGFKSQEGGENKDYFMGINLIQVTYLMN